MDMLFAFMYYYFFQGINVDWGEKINKYFFTHAIRSVVYTEMIC